MNLKKSFGNEQDLTPSSMLGSSGNTEAESLGRTEKNYDDDLGFDPFHETQKALAEMLEKESISNRSYQNNSCNHVSYATGHMQSLYSNPPSMPPMTRQSPSFGLGLGLGLGIGVAQQQPQPTRTRVPPPGFNPSQVNTPFFSFFLPLNLKIFTLETEILTFRPYKTQNFDYST